MATSKAQTFRLPPDVIDGLEAARRVQTLSGETLLRSKTETLVRLLRRALANQQAALAAKDKSK